MATLNCIVVTPEATALEQEAEFVALPLYDGEIGIGVGHSPMIGRLGYGEMRLGRGPQAERYYVDGGFVQVADNVVSVLTDRAVRISEVDGAAAEERLKAALDLPAHTDELLSIRDRQILQSRAQIRMSKRS